MKRQNKNIEKFSRTADKYVDIEEILPRVCCGTGNGHLCGNTCQVKRRQKIRTEYDGIGFIPLEELAKKTA